MKKKQTILAAALFAGLATAGCKKSEEKKDTSAPSVKDPATEVLPTGAANTSEDKAPTYSAEAATAALNKLAACDSQFRCKEMDLLVGFGVDAAAAMIDFSVDSSKGKKERAIAVAGLAKIKGFKDGEKAMLLFEGAKAEKDFILRGDMFDVAAAIADEATIEKMLTYYESEEADKARHQTDLLSSFREADKQKVMTWAAAKLATAKKDKETMYADLIEDAATKADLPKLEAMIAGAKDQMAKHRLAKTIISLGGDSKYFDVFMKGLTAKGGLSQYDRSDAANFLAYVADKVPSESTDAFVKALEDAKAKDKGGLTSMGYDKALKKLKK